MSKPLVVIEQNAELIFLHPEELGEFIRKLTKALRIWETQRVGEAISGKGARDDYGSV